jgi:hypothetical protein
LCSRLFSRDATCHSLSACRPLFHSPQLGVPPAKLLKQIWHFFTGNSQQIVPGVKMFDLAMTALIGVPFGFLAGYLWRDRISRARRARYRAERSGL